MTRRINPQPLLAGCSKICGDDLQVEYPEFRFEQVETRSQMLAAVEDLAGDVTDTLAP